MERRRGDKVPAGSLAADRVLRLEVVSEPGSNAIDRILHLIEEAETQRAPIERFIDRFSRWYTPAMMLVAPLVVLVPPLAFGQELGRVGLSRAGAAADRLPLRPGHLHPGGGHLGAGGGATRQGPS